MHKEMPTRAGMFISSALQRDTAPLQMVLYLGEG
jgi:hypothetical protein